MNKYKGYSIGISREWGISNGFNPVWYCEYGSRIQKTLVKLFANAIRKDHPASEKLAAMKTFSYVKMVEGPLASQDYESYRFYDEREFRLVYQFEDAQKNGLPLILAGDEEVAEYKKNHGGNKFLVIDNKRIGKRFQWTDVKYIIVKEESDIQEIKGLLKSLGCTNDDILFFHHEQILHDFLGTSHFKKSLPVNETDDSIEDSKIEKTE